MLTEQFLGICCKCCLNNCTSLNEKVFQSIDRVLSFYSSNISQEIQPKYKLACNLVSLRLKGKTVDSVLDNIELSSKFEALKDYIKYLSESKSKDIEIEDYIKQIQVREKLISVLKHFDKLQTFVEDFSTNSFDDLEEALGDYDEMVSDMYKNLFEQKRTEEIGSISSLDLFNDSYNDVMEQIRTNYLGENTVPTGFSDLDSFIRGGYDPSRLYIIGGSSGDGKSTFLMNCMKNAVTKDAPDPSGKKNIYVYITLENLIDESLVRLYSCWADIQTDHAVKSFLNDNINMMKHIKEQLEVHHANIEMKYFPPTQVSVFDIRLYLQSLKEKYKDTGRIRCVYIDYLDLLKSGDQFDLYRLELGQVALMLKVVSVLENIPVVTVTQLNREGYNKESFSLVQMSESIKKVEHSDFVGLLKAQPAENFSKTSYTDIDLYIGKNRAGPKDKKIKLRADFSKYKIEDGTEKAGIAFNQLAEELDGDIQGIFP